MIFNWLFIIDINVDGQLCHTCFSLCLVTIPVLHYVVTLQAGEARWGTDEEDLNAILCLRSRPQLKLTFREFEDLAGKTIEESIADECSGDLQEGYLAVGEQFLFFFTRGQRALIDREL